MDHSCICEVVDTVTKGKAREGIGRGMVKFVMVSSKCEIAKLASSAYTYKMEIITKVAL